jgi:hypothetical protein
MCHNFEHFWTNNLNWEQKEIICCDHILLYGRYQEQCSISLYDIYFSRNNFPEIFLRLPNTEVRSTQNEILLIAIINELKENIKYGLNSEPGT